MEWISRSLRPVYEAVEAVEASVEAVDAVKGLEAAWGRIDGDSSCFSTGISSPLLVLGNLI